MFAACFVMIRVFGMIDGVARRTAVLQMRFFGIGYYQREKPEAKAAGVFCVGRISANNEAVEIWACVDVWVWHMAYFVARGVAMPPTVSADDGEGC